MGVDQILAVRPRPVSGLPAGPFVVTLLATAAALLVMMAVAFAVALKAGSTVPSSTVWWTSRGASASRWSR